jgi:hypothetical protein
MGESAARRSHPAGPRPVGAPLADLDYSDIEDTTPSTPYPCARFRAFAKWFYAVRSWLFALFQPRGRT